MSTLPPEQLKILELAYFSGYTHVEIAEMLDLPRYGQGPDAARAEEAPGLLLFARHGGAQ
jgi:DNA-directed RNA polymerase specialized sigma24 family protein